MTIFGYSAVSHCCCFLSKVSATLHPSHSFIFNYALLQCLNTLDAHSDKVWALAVRPDGQEVVTGGADSVLKVCRSDCGLC